MAKIRAKRFPIVQGADGLMTWAAAYMGRVRHPKSARDIVDAWYLDWRGRKDKPGTVKKMHKTHNVDRIAKWMNRHHARGNLELVDHNGPWDAKRYRLVDGMRLTRPKPRKQGSKSV
jgi:hypothetical protein